LKDKIILILILFLSSNASLLTVQAVPDVSVSLQSDRATINDIKMDKTNPATITAVIRNEGIEPIENIKFYVDVPDSFTIILGSNSTSGSLSQDEELTVEFKVRAIKFGSFSFSTAGTYSPFYW